MHELRKNALITLRAPVLYKDGRIVNTIIIDKMNKIFQGFEDISQNGYTNVEYFDVLNCFAALDSNKNVALFDNDR